MYRDKAKNAGRANDEEVMSKRARESINVMVSISHLGEPKEQKKARLWKSTVELILHFQLNALKNCSL